MTIMQFLRTLLFSVLLLPHLAAAGDLAPRLVRDVDRTSYAASSSPRQISGVNDGLAFTAFGNRELWFYDGKEHDFTLGLKHREIRQLVDGIYAAREESGGWTLWVVEGFPYFQAKPLGTQPIARIGRAYQSPFGYGVWLFEADAGKGRGLWSLDGTAHAHEVARPLPFPDGLLLHDITLYRNRTFFVARDRHLGTALWAADGTVAGTSPVFAPAPEKTVSMILAGVVRNRLLLAVSGPETALWLSDGTPRGTRRLAAIGHGTAGITDAVQIPLTDRIVFVADDGRHGKQLWGTDGTAAGTKRLTGFATTDPFAGSPLSAATLAGRLAFFADDGVHGREIWSTDGTPAGTRLLVDACPGACGMAGDILLTLQATDTPPQPERLLFSSHLSGGHQGVDLWSTDGTAAGTGLLAGICSGACDDEPRGIAASYFPFSTAGPGTTFTAATPTGERALWFTDGTAEGTRKLTPPGATVTSTDPLAVSDAEFGDELWTTDGTPEGTHLWHDLGREIDSGSNPAFLGTVGDRILFSAFTPAHGIRLYASDGTAAGTLPLALPTPAPDLSVLAQSTTAAGRTLFSAWVRGTEKAALWGADTTGAVRLTPSGVTVNGGPFSLGQHAVFFAADAEHGSEPWVSDGTPDSTHLLADLVPGADPSSDGTGARTLHGQLLFSRWDDSQSWITDGTVEGTRRLLDAYPFLAPSANVQIPVFTEALGKVFFAGADAPNGEPELWVSSDWTAAGTHSLGFPGAGLGVDGIFPAGSRLFVFIAATDSSAPEPAPLWLVDPLSGAGAPVPLAADFRFGTLPPIAFGDRLVFSDAAEHLWVTDGTAEGTFLLHDPAGQEIVLGGGGRAISFAGHLIASVALVTSTDDFGPCYVWDGTGTTTSTATPAAGVLCSGDFFPVGPRLYFTGFQPDTGAEPWVFEEK